MNPYLLHVNKQMSNSSSLDFSSKSFLPSFPKYPSPKQKFKKLIKSKPIVAQVNDNLLVVRSSSLEKLSLEETREKYKEKRRNNYSYSHDPDCSYESAFSSYDQSLDIRLKKIGNLKWAKRECFAPSHHRRVISLSNLQKFRESPDYNLFNNRGLKMDFNHSRSTKHVLSKIRSNYKL